jgi:hypothetical protein
MRAAILLIAVAACGGDAYECEDEPTGCEARTLCEGVYYLEYTTCGAGQDGALDGTQVVTVSPTGLVTGDDPRLFGSALEIDGRCRIEVVQHEDTEPACDQVRRARFFVTATGSIEEPTGVVYQYCDTGDLLHGCVLDVSPE